MLLVLLGPDADQDIGWFWGLFSTPELAYAYVEDSRAVQVKKLTDSGEWEQRKMWAGFSWMAHPLFLVPSNDDDGSFVIIDHLGRVQFEINPAIVDPKE